MAESGSLTLRREAVALLHFRQGVASKYAIMDSVTMSASEIASLVRAGFQPEVVAAFDSMTITLDTNRLEVRGQLMTDVWGRAALGMLGGHFDALLRGVDRGDPGAQPGHGFGEQAAAASNVQQT